LSKVYLNIFKQGKHTLVAVCDQDVLGKVFREGRIRLEVSESFYGGTLCTISKAIEAIGEADIANLVGARVINAVSGKGLINPDAVMFISGVPHVQIVRI